MNKKSQIVCLCGSTKFKWEFEISNMWWTLMGSIVLAPGVFVRAGNVNITEEQKGYLDNLHLRKIDMSDVVYIVNPAGYIGESTRREIGYAESKNKKIVYYLENYPPKSILPEGLKYCKCLKLIPTCFKRCHLCALRRGYVKVCRRAI